MSAEPVQMVTITVQLPMHPMAADELRDLIALEDPSWPFVLAEILNEDVDLMQNATVSAIDHDDDDLSLVEDLPADQQWQYTGTVVRRASDEDFG